jgi:hypothetical protein
MLERTVGFKRGGGENYRSFIICTPHQKLLLE